MAEIRFTKFKIKGAHIGNRNCLPDIKNDKYISAPFNISDEISEDERKYIGKGLIPTLLPYMIQSGYDRERVDLEFDAAILENDFLKATFVTELGGRLWSLYDKKRGKELLYANDVFQPGNLALLNAWISGGVEWNIGIKGHNPLTCSPLFAEKLTDEKGNPMLRMYEYERIRGVAYSITAKLEDDVLLVHPIIENTADEDKYMYWWSNIAVDETPDTRVIVPTEKSFWCAYEEGAYRLGNTDIPLSEGVDVTYSTNLNRSRDFFYKIPLNEKKWITAVDGEGYGLVHLSTDELTGRKMFAWGQGKGGKHWNNWLSDSGKSYIEIQAGLLKTQLEHFIMKGNSVISWTEGYSALLADPAKLHGSDYSEAINEVKRHIERKQSIVEQADFDCDNGEIVYMGSGWGAVENMIREKPISNMLKFPKESIDEETDDWYKLLTENSFAQHDKKNPPISYAKGNIWIEKLSGLKDTWDKFYYLGVLYYMKGEVKKAYECFEKSVTLCPNAWAYRNLAQIEKNEWGNAEKGVCFMEKAVREKNDYAPLWVDYDEALIETENYSAVIEVYENIIPKELKSVGRIKMLYAFALSKVSFYEKALEVITDDFVMPDIKEGEFSVSHIWLDIHRQIMEKDGIVNPSDSEVYKKYPLPYELDFRMH